MADSALFENLDVTPDEIHRLEKAMKDEKFRQMLAEYAQELQDPENRRKYEEEIAMLEQNRGMNVTFLNPTPGYVLKTNNGEKKVFINLCQCDKIAEPKAEMATQDNNGVKKAGINWSMPYSLAPGREDLDKGGKKCMVYDVIFHPKSFESCKKDPRLKSLMESTALDGIEREFKEKLDRTNLKTPKIKFKGQPQSTVIRTPNTGGPTGESDALSDLNLAYPYDDNKKQQAKKGGTNQPAKSSTTISGSRNQTKKSDTGKTGKNESKTGPTQPKYTMTHRGHFDMQQFTNARDSMTSTRPQELIVRVELPLLKSAAPVQLDVYEKQIVLESKKPAAYKLDLALPYPVDDDKGSAKFDKSKCCLTITLPVLPPEKIDLPTFEPKNEETPSLVEEIESDDTVTDKNIEDLKAEEQAENVTDSKQQNNEDKTPTISDNKEESKQTETKQNDLDSDDDEQSTDHLDPTEVLPKSILKNESDHGPDATKVICPRYTFKQDSDTVIFVIQMPNIDGKSVKKDIDLHDDCEVKVQFRTNSADGSEDASINQYCLHVQFDHGCVIGEVMVELTTEGAVVVMVKEASCRGEWSGFKAGLRADGLKEKKFLTEDNIHDAIAESNDLTKNTKPNEMEVSSAKVTDQKLVAEFKTKEESSLNSKDDKTETAAEPATGNVVESQASVKSSEKSSPEALKLDLNRNDFSSGIMSSDTSPPTTPSSARSLKSVLRRTRRIEHTKSVSFSESVEVGVLVSPGKTKKGKNRPLVVRKRIERLDGESKGRRRRRYHSDSEVSYNPSGGTESYMEDFSEDFKKILQENKRTSRNRHSSSETESSTDDHHQAVKSSSKTRGGAKKQRKKQQKAKREIEFDNQRKQDDSQESGDNPDSPSSPMEGFAGGSVVNGKQHNKKTNSKKKEGKGLESTHDGNNNKEVAKITKDDKKRTKENEKHDDDEVPLEFQDHTTKNEVALQNDVMFELDD